MIFYLMNAKFSKEVPAYKGRPHTKFEENHVNRFWDMSDFRVLSSFHTNEKIAITRKRMI